MCDPSLRAKLVGVRHKLGVALGGGDQRGHLDALGDDRIGARQGHVARRDTQQEASGGVQAQCLQPAVAHVVQSLCVGIGDALLIAHNQLYLGTNSVSHLGARCDLVDSPGDGFRRRLEASDGEHRDVAHLLVTIARVELSDDVEHVEGARLALQRRFTLALLDESSGEPFHRAVMAEQLPPHAEKRKHTAQRVSAILDEKLREECTARVLERDSVGCAHARAQHGLEQHLERGVSDVRGEIDDVVFQCGEACEQALHSVRNDAGVGGNGGVGECVAHAQAMETMHTSLHGLKVVGLQIIEQRGLRGRPCEHVRFGEYHRHVVGMGNHNHTAMNDPYLEDVAELVKPVDERRANVRNLDEFNGMAEEVGA